MAVASHEHAAGGVFNTTHWSVVLTAGTIDSPDAFGALSRLAQTYWYPLYCCVRRHGYSPQDAQDLTQAFFAKLLENNQITLANPERGRFRTFLLRSLENFLRSAHRDATAQKRGGGRQLVSWDAQTAEDRYRSEPLSTSPEALFEKQWVGAMLETVLTALSRELAANSRAELFRVLEPHLWGDDTSTPYARIADNLKMTTVAVRVTRPQRISRAAARLKITDRKTSFRAPRLVCEFGATSIDPIWTRLRRTRPTNLSAEVVA